MSNDKIATLHVAREPASKDWTPTMGSDDKEYWYHFDGGEGGHGVFHARKNEKAVEFTVRLDADSDFRMHDVTFENSGDQLWMDKKKSNANRLVIDDANTEGMDGYYCVIVETKDGAVQIPCDPMIKNDPRPPS